MLQKTAHPFLVTVYDDYFIFIFILYCYTAVYGLGFTTVYC